MNGDRLGFLPQHMFVLPVSLSFRLFRIFVVQRRGSFAVDRPLQHNRPRRKRRPQDQAFLPGVADEESQRRGDPDTHAIEASDKFGVKRLLQPLPHAAD